MLQRALAGLYRLEGVQQAMLIDDSGQILASVGEEEKFHQFSTQLRFYLHHLKQRMPLDWDQSTKFGVREKPAP